MTSVQFSSVAQSCPTLCDPMNHSTPGLPVHHQLPEFTQTHVHRVSDAIQPSHPLSSPSPPALNPSQHQSLFQWVNSSYFIDINTETQEEWVILPRPKVANCSIWAWVQLSTPLIKAAPGSVQEDNVYTHMCETTKRPLENSVMECNVHKER